MTRADGPDGPPGWRALLAPDGAERLRGVEAEIAGGSDPSAVGAALRRAGAEPDEVSALLTQADLRRRARAKFGALASRLLFTPAGLEQATRAPIAALHAARFARAGCASVADLGCGIGAESLAIAGAGLTPAPVELDPFTARLAAHNLRAVGCDAEVRVGDAEALPLAHGVDGAFLDPARRTAGHRDTRRLASHGDYSPSLGFAFSHGDRMPTGVKLGPGLDRDLIPENAEAQWVSSDGQLVEMGLWFGAAARPGIGRAALVHRSGRDGDDHVHELTASADTPDAEARGLGEFLYEPDGAVIRARLIGLLAEQLGAGMVSARIAYLTGDELVPTPFAAAFRVLERLPAKEKQLRKALAAREIGRLEIKKRGADVDPAQLRSRLKLQGSRSATLFLTREGERHVALLAERC
ncbi:THUMP-like domain-containing protein [Leucobacter sp. gxy201]|uniref:THUMP-like domain-containing protein n=1 Tax=Leucobacter sp. gxy201 TaxID=2957200 RepID=UPI003DA0B323